MDQTSTHRTGPTAPRRSLRSTVLGVAAAALIAAWLPFTALFVSATQTVRAPIVAVKAGSVKAGQRVITTRTSSGQLVQSVVPAGQSAAGPGAASALTARSVPVTSRSS